jgi:trehalose/maltose hydrolase-like predicted phosphorylase
MKLKKVFILSLLLNVFFISGTFSQPDKSSFVKIVKGTGQSVPPGYVPPLISNGSLSMLVDYEGGQKQDKYYGMVPTIFWAGRRYGVPNDQLIPFGHFLTKISVGDRVIEKPDSWSQSLDTKNAVMTCRNDYGDSLSVETTVFCHLSDDIIVVKKRFSTRPTGPDKLNISFNYMLTPGGNENTAPRRMVSECVYNENSNAVEYSYEADGYPYSEGLISIISDHPYIFSNDKQVASLTSEISLSPDKPFELTYYILFEDLIEGKDFQKRMAENQSMVRNEGYDKLSDSHQNAWSAYHDESYIVIPDKDIEKVYYTAQYHLRCNATKWSFPVGIFSTHWAGRYFGWDEMFCFQALASSNHLDISRRCPEFRHSVLPKARHRVAHYGKPGNYGARYPWESLENGTEGAPTPKGFWLDHVFHMSNISLSCWMQYEYSGDLNYLKTVGYPVIKECARFYVTHMVYENEDGSMFLGKCTDLERLGPAKRNPFLTACGAIYTLEKAAKASALLETDVEESNDWKHIASELRKSLPQDSGRYIPYKGCTEKSVAVLAGLFPYPVFDKSNQLQKNAVYDFIESGRASGNMYPVGTEICAWYAGKMASALAILGDKTEPERLLSSAAKYAGSFSDLFEINEPKVTMHPWFSTASGNYIYALNQMLLQCKNDDIIFAPAVPDNWNDLSFKLPCYGNIVTEISIDKGEIKKLIFKSGDPSSQLNRRLFIPERFIDKKDLDKVFKGSPVILKDGYYITDVSIKGETTVI